MSAFAVIYDCFNTPVEAGVLKSVMARLAHRGPDGSDILLSGNLAMGHWRFWTTPEEVGERQPLKVEGLPFTLVFDGRLDNRRELFLQLSLPAEVGHSLSDAALLLHAYAAWGERCVEHFVGEFAFVLFDERRKTLFCARDHLGDRTLFYAWYGSRFVAASEAWAVAGAQDGMEVLDEKALAYYFALRLVPDGRTLFQGVFELLPAHSMLVDENGARQICYWRPDTSRKVRFKSDAEYAEQFRSLLEEGVACRLRSSAPVGVLMSGGLDSTSVACLAARMVAPQQLTTISYVFDELPDCDERAYINAVWEKWSIRSIQIACDDAWPFKDLETLPANPNQPEGNPYRHMKERAYARARAEGLRVLLTGGFGDHLYSGAQDNLADMVRDGRFLMAAREFASLLRTRRFFQALNSAEIRRLVRRLLGLRSRRRSAVSYPWLTPHALAQMSPEGDEKPSDPVLEARGNLVGLWAAYDSSREAYHASRHAVELRHPYRHRPLVEYCLALPAYQFYRNGQYKYILRQALAGILPDLVRLRPRQTSIVSFFARGLEREKGNIESVLKKADAECGKFVRLDWLSTVWTTPLTRETDGPQALAPWLCVSYSLWRGVRP